MRPASLLVIFGAAAVALDALLASCSPVARAVAARDLSFQINVASKDETGRLVAALRNINTQLLDIVGRVKSGTDTIPTASTQIAAGNLALSSRTEQQASSLEETASSMEELTSTIKQNADNARQANGLATQASEVAREGGIVVAQVVDAMTAINDSSRKIVDIISVIDGSPFRPTSRNRAANQGQTGGRAN